MASLFIIRYLPYSTDFINIDLFSILQVSAPSMEKYIALAGGMVKLESNSVTYMIWKRISGPVSHLCKLVLINFELNF